MRRYSAHQPMQDFDIDGRIHEDGAVSQRFAPRLAYLSGKMPRTDLPVREYPLGTCHLDHMPM